MSSIHNEEKIVKIVKLLSFMSDDIDEIKHICLKARYNKSISNTFIELIMLSAEPIVKLYLLLYSKDGQEDDMNIELEHLKLENPNALEKFKTSLINIKEFTKFMTQIYGSISYKDAVSIKRNFDQIIGDYRTCVEELNPKLPMNNINEQECLKAEEINDFIEKQSLVMNKKLNHGFIICDRGIYSTEFLAQFQININPINENIGKFHVNLVPIKQRKDTLLKYHIMPSAIGLENFQFISNQLVDEPSNYVYLEIKYPLWELVSDKENIKLPENLIKDIKDALKCNNPHQKLMQTFKHYGHFVPSKLTLGHKLYRVSYLKKHKALFEKKKIVTHEYFESNEFKEFCDQWNDTIIHFNFDESHLLSMNSGIFERKNIKDWASSLSNNVNLEIISWDELYPLYELLDDNLKQKVKTIFGINHLAENTRIKENMLMSGVITITDSSYYIVKFPHELSSENYRIFGRLVTQDGKPIDAIIKFKAMTIHNFVVWIDIDKTVKSIHPNLQIFWFMTGLPEIGFYSPNTRNVSILESDSFAFAYAKEQNIQLQLPRNLPKNWILCSSFQYHNCMPSFATTNIQYDKDNNEIYVTIHDYSDILSNKYDQSKKEYFFHWCIISKDHEILPDVLKSREALVADNPNGQENQADVLQKKRFPLSSIGQDIYEKPDGNAAITIALSF
ncbi:45243_t:CDS:2 [Gigaspora margarita]|uniref:45243_t:CDS:1 n=1 Tax=Gigaspora margarita TaxID=4874 RepID=A0ABN7UW75_GIGMA|nr:45243_t:CDS:2 [Gigaspora margarita]